MIKVVVCDDHVQELEKITLFLEEFSRKVFPLNIQTFSSSLALSHDEAIVLTTDIFFLDIVMPELSGIELGKIIRKQRKDAIIVYFTTSKDFALDAYGVQALQYLLKPVRKQDLYDTLKNAMVLIKRNERYYLIQTRSEQIPVKINDIQFVEYKDHFLHFYLSNKVITSKFYRDPFSIALETLFNDAHFIQTHRAFLVNMDHVDTMHQHSFKMNNQAIVPIAKSRLLHVRKYYIDYLLKG